MLRRASIFVVACLALTPALLFAGQESTERLKRAAAAVQEIMQTRGRATPQELLDSACAVVIVPGVKKGSFGRRLAPSG